MAETTITVEPGKQEISMERTFNAPAAKVFAAFTDVEKVKKWWGGRTYKTNIQTYEARSGGSWRMVQTTPDGQEAAFHGVFHEVTPNERIIWTFEFDGLPEKGHALMETMRFTEESGKTTVKTTSVFQSVADRDGMVASGMGDGARESYDVLAEIVENDK